MNGMLWYCGTSPSPSPVTYDLYGVCGGTSPSPVTYDLYGVCCGTSPSPVTCDLYGVCCGTSPSPVTYDLYGVCWVIDHDGSKIPWLEDVTYSSTSGCTGCLHLHWY